GRLITAPAGVRMKIATRCRRAANGLLPGYAFGRCGVVTSRRNRQVLPKGGHWVAHTGLFAAHKATGIDCHLNANVKPESALHASSLLGNPRLDRQARPEHRALRGKYLVRRAAIVGRNAGGARLRYRSARPRP